MAWPTEPQQSATQGRRANATGQETRCTAQAQAQAQATELTPDDLQMLAAPYRQMAKAASTPDEAYEVIQLAKLYDGLATRAVGDDFMTQQKPSEPPPSTR